MRSHPSSIRHRFWIPGLFATALLSLGAFDQSCLDLQRDDCICPEMWAPVCGDDGKTYGNACNAQCESVRIVHEGECEGVDDGKQTASHTACMSDRECQDGQRCDTVNFCESHPACANGEVCPPVCYGRCVSAHGGGENCQPVMCRMYCENGFAIDPATGCETCACKGDVKPDPEPQPDPDCICTFEYAPVCGVDGNTYGNACAARCAGVKVAHRGECEKNCDIQCFVYDPVCGVNGVTYGCGEVEASCNGVAVAHPGECGQGCDVDAAGNGNCAPNNHCAQASDCDGLVPVVDCVGDWTCSNQRCIFECSGGRGLHRLAPTPRSDTSRRERSDRAIAPRVALGTSVAVEFPNRGERMAQTDAWDGV